MFYLEIISNIQKTNKNLVKNPYIPLTDEPLVDILSHLLCHVLFIIITILNPFENVAAICSFSPKYSMGFSSELGHSLIQSQFNYSNLSVISIIFYWTFFLVQNPNQDQALHLFSFIGMIHQISFVSWYWHLFRIQPHICKRFLWQTE